MALPTIKLTLPKALKKGGRAATPTFNPQQTTLSAPTYRQHLSDLYNGRQANDSRTLLNDLVNHDPDVSAAVHAFLSISGSAPMMMRAYDLEGRLSLEGIELARTLLERLTTVTDYSVGYSHKEPLDALNETVRYWFLLRGMAASELIFDKAKQPMEPRYIDPASLEWEEKQAGVFVPRQRGTGSNDLIDLNVATFFTERFHQSPVDIYTYSPFVAAINTIGARTEVINELYRIMRVVGYPRMHVEVLEEVLSANAPVTVRQDPGRLRAHVQSELGRVTQSLANIRSDEALVTSSAIKPSIINDKNPGAGMQVQQVIDVLDGQNQAALKVMPAVVGKSSNVNTASTEARLFALEADALNRAVARMHSKQFTLAARLAGFQGRVEVAFRPVELRPELELEPQRVMKSSRLLKDLSTGIITDLEYHMEMYGRPPGPDAPELSGTNFLTPNAAEAEVDVESISPNSDPLGRAVAPEGGKSARSNNGGTGGDE